MLDAWTAALLWQAAEHSASILVSALPRLAGKTTTLNTFLRFTQPGTTFRAIQGEDDPFEFVNEAPSSKRYLVCNEFSPAPVPTYLWGPKVRRFLQAGKDGHPIAVTMHADSFDDVPALLSPTGVQAPDLAALHLYAQVRVVPTDAGAIRRLVEVRQVSLDEGGHLVSEALVAWQPQTDTWHHTPGDSLLRRIIPAPSWRLDSVMAELEGRARYLEGAFRDGSLERDGLSVVLGGYRSDPAAAVARYS
jgi:hypothetical protein